MEFDSNEKLNTAYIEENEVEDEVTNEMTFASKQDTTCWVNYDVDNFYLEASDMDEMSMARCASNSFQVNNNHQHHYANDSPQKSMENFDLKDSCLLFASDYETSVVVQADENAMIIPCHHKISDLIECEQTTKRLAANNLASESKNQSLKVVNCRSVYSYLGKKVTKWFGPSKKSTTSRQTLKIHPERVKPTSPGQPIQSTAPPTSYMTTAYLVNQKSNFFPSQYQIANYASPIKLNNKLQSKCGDLILYEI
jgi:hypothetical protein